MKRTIPALAIVSLIFFSFVLLFAQNQGSSLNINVRDYCDPTTFNAAVGPGQEGRHKRTTGIGYIILVSRFGAPTLVHSPRRPPCQQKNLSPMRVLCLPASLLSRYCCCSSRHLSAPEPQLCELIRRPFRAASPSIYWERQRPSRDHHRPTCSSVPIYA